MSYSFLEMSYSSRLEMPSSSLEMSSSSGLEMSSFSLEMSSSSLEMSSSSLVMSSSSLEMPSSSRLEMSSSSLEMSSSSLEMSSSSLEMSFLLYGDVFHLSEISRLSFLISVSYPLLLFFYRIVLFFLFCPFSANAQFSLFPRDILQTFSLSVSFFCMALVWQLGDDS